MLGLRLNVTDDERRVRINNMIAQLHLTKCMDTIIQKLSGGEKKRLALATVFCMDPHVLLIDEPTSGLDAYLAMDIMNTIRLMAVEQRKTIIVVIHQPTDAMFDLIDTICLLVRGGRQVFFGSKEEAVNFFITECCLSPLPLDVFIEQLAAPTAKNADENTTIQEMVADQYVKSDLANLLQLDIERNFESMDKNSFMNIIGEMKRVSFGRQLKWLFWRSFKADTRASVRTTFILIRILFIVLVFGLLYFHLCGSNHFVQNLNALIFIVLSVIINTSAYMILSTMPINNYISIKENLRGIYNEFAYYLVVVIHDLPTFIIFPFLATSVTYWMSGMDNTWSHYFLFGAIGILSGNIGAAIGQVFAAFSGSVESAVSVAIPVLQILIIFSGFYFDLTHSGSVLHIIHYISPFYYSYSAMLTIQWDSNLHNNTSYCNSFQHLSGTSTSMLPNMTAAVGLCTHVLNHLTFQNLIGNLGFKIFMLFILFGVCHTIAFIAIWYRVHRREVTEYWTNMKNNYRTSYQALP